MVFGRGQEGSRLSPVLGGLRVLNIFDRLKNSLLLILGRCLCSERSDIQN